MKIQKVGVVGCGQMGGGIVHVCARAGYRVLVSESSEILLQGGLKTVTSWFEKSVKKGALSLEEKEAALGRICATTDIADFHDCDLVIEAVTEDLALKKAIFSRLDSVCPSHSMLATNTSSLSVAEIATATRRPDRVLGLHFFNPVPVMRLLEVIGTAATSEATLKAGVEFGRSLGKTVVTVTDTPGFIVNRLMISQILGAVRLLEAGIATREDIDTAMVLGLNHPLGPLALADLIGLDTVLAIAESIHRKTGDEQYSTPKMLRDIVSEGNLGRKTGKGFYSYF